MATFGDVLGNGPLELTGVGSDPHSALTMARDPATGRRAFRLVHYRGQHAMGNAIINAVEVFGYGSTDCTKGRNCSAGTGQGFTLRFDNPIPMAGASLEFGPLDHDGGLIDRLLSVCDCSADNVYSQQLCVTVLVLEYPPGQRPIGHLTTFRSCKECGAVRE